MTPLGPRASRARVMPAILPISNAVETPAVPGGSFSNSPFTLFSRAILPAGCRQEVRDEETRARDRVAAAFVGRIRAGSTCRQREDVAAQVRERAGARAGVDAET